MDKEKNKFQSEVYELMSQLEGSNKDKVRHTSYQNLITRLEQLMLLRVFDTTIVFGSDST